MSEGVSRETGVRRVTVVGTGTGVGKTHVGVALVAVLARRGLRVCGLKPIESGVVEGALTDAEQLARVSSVAPTLAPYRLERAVSPHLAAREVGLTISVEVAARWVAEQSAEVQVVETAGALLSPLGQGLTNLDLARALRGDALVLVGLDRLGVLHDVAACVLALKTLAPELPDPLVVLNEPEAWDTSTGSNAEELRWLGIAREVVVMPRAEPEAEGTLRGAAEMVHRLGW